jgi:hypothetical protein
MTEEASREISPLISSSYMDNEIFILHRMLDQFSIWKKPKIWWWIQRHDA